MRLKILFFPIMLIISISIFIGFIWPEISNIKIANKEYTSNLDKLKNLNDKQEAIRSIGSQLQGDSSKKQLVDDYLPKKPVEERVISSLNNLATSSGVALADVSISQLPDPNIAAPGAVVDPSVSAVPVDTIRFSQAKISVSGSYDNIKLFADQVQHMGIYNKLEKISLVRDVQQAKTADASSAAVSGMDNASTGATTITAPSNNLAGVLIVDFGYLKNVIIDKQKIEGLKMTFDDNALSNLKSYIKANDSSIDIGPKGATNPFFK